MIPVSGAETTAVVTQPEVQPEPVLTWSATEAEVDGLKSLVPAYAAESFCSLAWAKQATSEAVPPLRVAVPRLEPSAEKVTVPVGEAVGDVTVAVRVTFWPVTAEVGETVSAVAVEAASIVCVTAPLAEAEKLPSPG